MRRISGRRVKRRQRASILLRPEWLVLKNLVTNVTVLVEKVLVTLHKKMLNTDLGDHRFDAAGKPKLTVRTWRQASFHHHEQPATLCSNTNTE